jgi:hypothetical protein
MFVQQRTADKDPAADSPEKRGREGSAACERRSRRERAKGGGGSGRNGGRERNMLVK